MAYRGGGGSGRRGRPQSSSATSTYSATLLAADRILSKETEYKQNVAKIHAHACMLAGKIAVHGDVQQSLTASVEEDDGGGNGGDQDDAEIFLMEQRTKLKDISTANAKRQRDVETFLLALGAVRDDVRAKQDVGARGGDDDGEEGADETSPDYTSILQEKIDHLHAQSNDNDGNEESSSSLTHHTYCQEMRNRLGEKEPKRSRRSSRAGNDDDDDDPEIIPTQGVTRESAGDLKCPITGMWYDRPLRNTVCKHVISQAGFEQMCRTRKYKCPVYGCANTQNYTRALLEDDYEMEMKVKAHLSRVRREQERHDDDDEDDDQEEYDANETDDQKMTIIE